MKWALCVLCGALVTGCGGKSPVVPSSSGPPPVPSGTVSSDVTVRIVSNSGTQAFSPNPVTVSAGGTVAFQNDSASTHRIVEDNGAWDTGRVSPGTSSAAIAVGTAAKQSYHCTIHGSMVGTVN